MISAMFYKRVLQIHEQRAIAANTQELPKTFRNLDNEIESNNLLFYGTSATATNACTKTPNYKIVTGPYHLSEFHAGLIA